MIELCIHLTELLRLFLFDVIQLPLGARNALQLPLTRNSLIEYVIDIENTTYA